MRRVEAAAKRGDTRVRSALITAYREGLGLAAITVTRGPAGVRISTAGQGGGVVSTEPAGEARWWCRRSVDAERLAAAATRRLQRHESRDGSGTAASERVSSPLAGDPSDTLVVAGEAIAGAAKRLNIALLSDEEVHADVMAVIARVDAEIEKLQRSGELKSLNKSYRTYRIETSARGEKTLRYDEWMGKYRENLVRQLAAALRYA
jgi:hypothetical protein